MIIYLNRQKIIMHENLVIQMQTNRFPFGQIKKMNIDHKQAQKVFVRNRVEYRNQKERNLFQNKLNILKKLYHRNIINVRMVEQIPSGGYDIYYNYVPYALESAFDEIGYQTFKQLHRQIIHLAIHLAKNYILTSFNASRCGVVYIEGQVIIKYYLPLNQIVITDNISMLERSVQLFKVQATHFLDTLCHNDELTESNSSSFEEFVSHSRLNMTHKQQHSGLSSRLRKLSNVSMKPERRFSNTKSIKSNVSGATDRKKSHDSTHHSDIKILGLKQTLKSLRQNSWRKRNWEKQKLQLRNRIELLYSRSKKALQIFQSYKIKWEDYAQLMKMVSRKRVI